MIILENKNDLIDLKEKNLIPNDLLYLVEKDINFIFDEFPHLKYKNYLIKYVLIKPNENIKHLILDNIDLLTKTKPLNILSYENIDIIKATTKTPSNYYISVYFYRNKCVKLMNWIK
ncbi:TPA: hypothetical protein I9Z31_000961 [Clostridium perfringens]|nr:hypothetical protein [Clostridium perfringens]EJT6613122.1 hypothetical protein [Clostridium perfringens]MDU2659253.1 hypothetical protein [Clostridium perfringens]HAT4103560.1 hypothetical protein [Clostridium perfringens]